MASTKTYAQTPVVTFKYVHLSRPDPKFGKYGVTFDAAKEVVQDLLDTIDQFAADNFPPKTLANKSFRRGYSVNEDGTYRIKAGTKHAVDVVDAKGRPIDVSVVRVGGGSRGRLSVQLVASNGDKPGVTVYLKAAQVGKLVEYTAGGFDDISDEFDEEDAYIADDDVVAAGEAARKNRRSSQESNKGDTGDDSGSHSDDASEF